MTSHHYLTAARCSLVVAVALTAGIACAQQPLLVYGPGGPAPAMKEAAAAFEHANGTKVTVTAGPTPSWIDHAKQDADIIYSGSETMMTDFTGAMGGKIQEASSSSHSCNRRRAARSLPSGAGKNNVRRIAGLRRVSV